jgi:uncharacterized protein YcnI
VRTATRIAALTAGLLVMTATAAFAHPGFNPNQMPVGEPVEAIFVVTHGCTFVEGDAQRTVRVDLGYTDQVRFAAHEVDGWDVVDDGEAIVWTDAGGSTADTIVFPLTVTVTSGAEGDRLYLPVFQECAAGDVYRWVAEPGQDGDPAARLDLTAGEVSTTPIDDDDNVDDGSDDGSEHAHDPTEEPTTVTDPATDPATDATEAAPAPDTDEAGMVGTVLVGLLILALAAGVYAFTRARTKES